jgi:cytochrome b561
MVDGQGKAICFHQVTGVTVVWCLNLRVHQGHYHLPTLTNPTNFYSEMGHLAIYLYLFMCTFVGFFNIPMT